jgi:tetratricopeptide (TPR) repeat protein
MQEATQGQNEKTVGARKTNASLENALFWILSGLILLLPIIFLPTVAVSFLFVKYGLLALAVVSVVTIWILLRLKDGVCLLPINMLNLSALLVLSVLLLSSLLSGSIWNSLIGQLAQTDTFIFYLILFVIVFIAPSVFNNTKRILSLYKIFFVSLSLLAIFHITRLLFGPGWLDFGYFNNLTDNVLGKWNDLGIFFGLGAVLSLVSLELLVLSKRSKIILSAALIVSVLLLMVINFASIWYVLGILALVFFVYSIVIARSGSTKKTAQVALPITSFGIFVISVVFVIGGARIGNVISSYLHISQIDVIPTWQATGGIAKNVILQGSPIRFAFGAGPNRFVNEWQLYKPVGVNSSIFWNTDFSYGVGIVPSSLVTAGVFGLLAWLAFLGILIYMGFRSILSRISNPVQRYLVTSAFLASLYLWLFNVLYVPGLVIIVLTFFFTGLFLAALYNADILKPVRFEYFKNPKIGFVSVLVLVLILIGGLGLAYVTVTKFIAAVYYNQGIADVNSNKLDAGEQKVKTAVSFDTNDLYVRALAQISLVRLGNLLNTKTDSASPDVLRSQFSTISNAALSAANSATLLDSRDYQNWLTLGDVWSAFVPLKIDKAYDNALSDYQRALSYNPQNPYIYLELAKLDSAQNNAAQAKGDLNKALALKANYADAYLFLAQLQISEGDTKSAIDSVTAATISSPDNPGLFFQLGVLRYNNKDYTNAIGAFEQAVALDNQYSNAKYFLGLSYYQLDRTADAITQFIDLQKLNPDNQEVTNILTNLQSGKSPFPKTEAPAAINTATTTAQKAKK